MTTRHKGGLSAAFLVVGVLLWSDTGVAQILHPVSESRSCYARAVVACGDSVELFANPPGLFAVFSDTLIGRLEKCNDSFADASAGQYSEVRGDSIWVEETIFGNDGGRGPFVATARSDASIRFRIEAGQQCQCVYRLDYTAEQGGFGRIAVQASLSKLGPAGPTALMSVDVNLTLPGIRQDGLDGTPILHAGEYVFDAHLFVDDGSFNNAALLGWVKLSHITAVSESTWSRVKTRYR